MNKVLIVDDSTAMRKIVRDVLVRAGFELHEVLEACNGVEGLRFLEQHPDVRLVLSDLFMPQLDGFGLLKRMRAKRRIKDVPVVILSSEERSTAVQAALEGGAVGCLIRPFTPEGVRRALEAYLGAATDDE